MAKRYAIFPTALAPTTAPDPAEAGVIYLDRDPSFGTESYSRATLRGSVIPTLGGNQVQHMAAVVSDGRLKIEDAGVAGSFATVQALATALNTPGAEFFFTDGFNVWRVTGAPGGACTWDKLRAWQIRGAEVYDYALSLIVLEEVL